MKKTVFLFLSAVFLIFCSSCNLRNINQNSSYDILYRKTLANRGVIDIDSEGEIYFSQGSNIYKADPYKKILPIYSQSHFLIFNDMLYYFNVDGLNVYSLNNKDNSLLYPVETTGMYFTKLFYLTIGVKPYLFFIGGKYSVGSDYSCYKFDLTKKVLEETFVVDINVSDKVHYLKDGLIYLSKSQNAIVKYSYGGEFLQKFQPDNLFKLYFAEGDDIYYSINSDNNPQLCSLNTESGEKKLVYEGDFNPSSCFLSGSSVYLYGNYLFGLDKTSLQTNTVCETKTDERTITFEAVVPYGNKACFFSCLYFFNNYIYTVNLDTGEFNLVLTAIEALTSG